MKSKEKIIILLAAAFILGGCKSKSDEGSGSAEAAVVTEVEDMQEEPVIEMSAVGVNEADGAVPEAVDAEVTPKMESKSMKELLALGVGKTTHECLKSIAYDEEYDLPMFIIINEEMSTRYVLKEGETYQLAKDDDLVVYLGKSWSFREISPFYPADDILDITTGDINAWDMTFDLDSFNLTSKTEFYINVASADEDMIFSCELIPAK